jgi:hypothetical protein
MKAFVIAALAIAATSASAQGGQRTTCLRYEPDTARIAGTLTRHMYYGAPGYGEDPTRDDKEVGFYLHVAAPLCMQAGSDDSDVARSGIRRIQLVLDQDGYTRLRPYLGKKVTLRGTLFGAFTGHHHTPVILDVSRPARVER